MEAGNSVAIIHAHYRELATKAEAEAWFGITLGEVTDAKAADAGAAPQLGDSQASLQMP